MMKYPATLLCDFYKISHREQYPEGTQKIYSTWTPRESKLANIDHVVAFGFQYFIQEFLIDYFRDNFFERQEADVAEEYARVIKATLGVENPDTTHIRALHKLGYLPLRIKAVKEGSLVPIKVPMLTIENTRPEFFWLTNYLETLMSCTLWKPSTSATIAHEYRKLLDEYAKKTGNEDFVQFQGHDFSMRGLSSLDSAAASGAGHLLSFVGTDTIPGILFHEKYYGADVDKELVGTSIPATEHSVMCAGGKETELETYRRIITKVYPKGFVSIVSDTWDLWKVLSDIVTPLKDDILAREGKVVIRPDSGDPVKIICGDDLLTEGPASKGVIEILWDIFGGTVNDKGYKELDPHIGVIYGDAITLDRCRAICWRLEEKGFASTNMVYGIGSYTYQYNTRDTFGFALKSTYAKINDEEKFLEKDPVTDDGAKKSAHGMVVVTKKYNESTFGPMKLMDGLNEAGRERNKAYDLLEDVFIDGKLVRQQTLADIREHLANGL